MNFIRLFHLIKRYILIILIVIYAVVIIGILTNEMTKHTPGECSRPDWKATYIGWDDDAGPCTYPQRVTFDLFTAFVFPFVTMWPVPLVAIALLISELLHRQRPSLRQFTTLMLVSPVLGWIGWLLLVGFLTVFDSGPPR